MRYRTKRAAQSTAFRVQLFRTQDTSTEGEWESDQVTVVSDDNVSRGGCRIESDFGFVEASVEAQFEEIERAVLAEEPSHAMVAQNADASPVSKEAAVPQE